MQGDGEAAAGVEGGGNRRGCADVAARAGRRKRRSGIWRANRRATLSGRPERDIRHGARRRGAGGAQRQAWTNCICVPASSITSPFFRLTVSPTSGLPLTVGPRRAFDVGEHIAGRALGDRRDLHAGLADRRHDLGQHDLAAGGGAVHHPDRRRRRPARHAERAEARVRRTAGLAATAAPAAAGHRPAS